MFAKMLAIMLMPIMFQYYWQ